jgi:hypothetical protein
VAARFKLFSAAMYVRFRSHSKHVCQSAYYMQSPCNLLIEDYTEVFYMNDEGDVSSIQCEMSLRWSKFMREADGPSLILIDFNVPGLAPRLN